MALGCAVCSCSDFLTGRTSHSIRCASYLLFDLKGQTKLISVIRSGLDIADYATLGSEPEHSNIVRANKMLGDVKIILNFACLPQETISLKRKCEKTGRSFQIIYAAYREGRPISSWDWILAGTRTSGTIKKVLSIVGDGIFKPVQLVGKYAELGPAGAAMGETWQILSMVKTGAKIANYSGKLYLGSKKPEKKVVDVILEVWELSHTILRYSHVHVHPIAGIALSVSKSMFGLAEAWMKTT
jgi:hypothetical protein